MKGRGLFWPSKPHLFLCSGVDGCLGLSEALPLPGKVGFSSLPVGAEPSSVVPSFEGSSWHKQGPLFYCTLHSAPVAQCSVTGLSQYVTATTLAKERGEIQCIVRAVIVACLCRYYIMIALFSLNDAECLYMCFEFFIPCFLTFAAVFLNRRARLQSLANFLRDHKYLICQLCHRDLPLVALFNRDIGRFMNIHAAVLGY